MAGPALFAILFFVVYRQIHQQRNWQAAFAHMLEAVTGKQQWKLWVVFLLMFCNWGIEARKWQIAVRTLQPLSFLRSFKAILAGTTVASFTPNRVGDYFGRMLFVQEGKKMQSISPTIVCSMAQMIITFVIGVGGIFLFGRMQLRQATLSYLSSGIVFTVAFYISLAAALMVLSVYFGFKPIVRFLNRWLSKYFPKISIPAGFSTRDLLMILLLSLLRYMVFILQYYLLFSLFTGAMPLLQVASGVSVMFVLMAIIPTLTFITDIGVRWETGIQVFSVFTPNTTGIFAVSLGIWLINLIIPALIGSLLILRIKLFSSR